MTTWTKDYIAIDDAQTLHGLLNTRIKRSATRVAYRYWDKNAQTWRDFTWQEIGQRVDECEKRLAQIPHLDPGDRVGIMSPNNPWWVIFEQAAMRRGLVVVPLFPNDRPDNVAYICQEAKVKVMLINNGAQWTVMRDARHGIAQPPQLISFLPVTENTVDYPVIDYSSWIAQSTAAPKPPARQISPRDLATIVYTSGTTGKPKGVMLSHLNILANARYGIESVDVYHEDLFLSFLPLSHTLERTVGYYIPVMTGATVAFARSIPELAEDLLTIKPTVLISVPRIFERVYAKIQAQLQEKSPTARKLFNLAVSVGYEKFEVQQGRRTPSARLLLWPLLNALVAKKVMAKLGGRMRFSISGGAALSKTIGETFIGLGLPVLQGYGLTEASPVISVNRHAKNIPASIGPALPHIDVRLSAEGELQTRSACTMLGYWNNDKATKESFTDDGWLRSGDLAKIVDDYIYIVGRLKDIIVLSNGEKVPPDDMQMAIALDPLFEHVLIIGEGKPFLAAIVVLAADEWKVLAAKLGLAADDANSARQPKVKEVALQRINKCLSKFPGYAQIRQVTLTTEPWTDQNGLLTPSLKIKRKVVMDKFATEIAAMYAGH